MLKKTLLAALVFGVATTAVQANEVSGYVTGSVGQAKADKPKVIKNVQNDISELNELGFATSTSTDRTDTAYKIAVGLKVNPYLALEAQYTDLGKANYKAGLSFADPEADFAVAGSQKVNMKTSGLGANLVGMYPIEDFTVFAKVGYHLMKTKGTLKESVSVSFDGETEGFSESSSETIRKWAPSFGIGASYNITKELSLVAEYERYQDVANKKITIDGEKVNFKHDIDLASVGLRYNF